MSVLRPPSSTSTSSSSVQSFPLRNVSAQAILRRAHDLALIDAAQYRIGCVYISKQGYRRSEPFEPDQIETPELLATILSTLHKQCRMKPRRRGDAARSADSHLGETVWIGDPRFAHGRSATRDDGQLRIIRSDGVASRTPTVYRSERWRSGLMRES